MSFLNNFKKMQAQQIWQSQIEHAKKQFEPKPFVEEWFRLKVTAFWFRPFLAMFSIITGFSFLFLVFQVTLPLAVSALLALVLITGIEYAKTELVVLAFKRLLGSFQSMASFLLLFIGLIGFGLSVIFSVFGAQELYRNLDQSSLLLEAQYEAERDSLNRSFNLKIGEAKQELLAFRKSVSWQEKINMSNPDVARGMTSRSKRIDILEEDQRQALNLLKAQQDKLRTSLESKNGFNIQLWLIVSIGVELAIILCLWFMTWFNFKTYEEAELYKQHLPSFSFTTDEIQKLIHQALLHTYRNESGNAYAPNALENSSEAQNKDAPSHKKSLETMNGIKVNPDLVRDLFDGIRDMRQLTQKHKVNVNTVDEHKRVFLNGSGG